MQRNIFYVSLKNLTWGQTEFQSIVLALSVKAKKLKFNHLDVMYERVDKVDSGVVAGGQGYSRPPPTVTIFRGAKVWGGALKLVIAL